MNIKTISTREAIERSYDYNEIVNIEWTQENFEVAMIECDDHVTNGDVQEFWGDDWRIHLHKN